MAGVSLDGLAEAWEGDAVVRSLARQNGQLVQWPNPTAVGIPSMILAKQLFLTLCFQCNPLQHHYNLFLTINNYVDHVLPM